MGAYFAGSSSAMQEGKHSITESGSGAMKYGMEKRLRVIRWEPSNLSDNGGRVTRWLVDLRQSVHVKMRSK